MSLADNPSIDGPFDVVVPSVTALPATPPFNTMVYLTAQAGANAPGLYIYADPGNWVMISAGAVVE